MLKQAGVLSMLLFLGSYSAHGADVALWRFDADGKSAGQTADTVNDSIGGHTGSAVNAPVYSATISPKATWGTAVTSPNYTLHGGLANTMSLSLAAGSSQYISVPDAADLRMGSAASFTVEGWVKLNTLPTTTSGRQWLVHKSAGTDATTDYGVLVGGADLAASGQTWANPLIPITHPAWTGGELVLVFGNGSTMQTAVSNLAITDTNWHYVMVSYNGSKHEVVFMLDYNGTELLKNVNPSNTAGAGALIIGGHSTGAGADQTFDGLIDEVRISNHSLSGSPDAVGIPGNLAGTAQWWWNIEGAVPDAAFNLNGERPWRIRNDSSRLPEANTDFWDVAAVPGDAGNNFLQLRSFGGLSGGYAYWDNQYLGGAPTYIAPDNRARGSTLVVRFRFPYYLSTNTSDPHRTHKFIRIQHQLKNNPFDAKGSKLHFQVGPANLYSDPPSRTGIALYRNEEGPPRKIITGDLSLPENGGDGTGTGWHTLHATMYIDPANPAQVLFKTWLDGTLIDSWTQTGNSDGPGQYLPNNDNNNSQQCDVSLDYVRFSADAAWGPDGTLYTPEGDLGLCSNGIDDDGVNGTDCADPSCASASVCKCYPHVLWADQDDDLDVDMDDFGVFQACYTGSGTFGLVQPCSCLDRDDDKDVDADDFNAFLVCASGPGIASPGCP